MDKNEIQRRILSGAFGENQYNRVNFLNPNDFTNSKDYPFRDMFQVVADANGNFKEMYKADKRIIEHLCCVGVLADYTCLERLGCLLIEANFRELFDRLIADILETTDNETEIGIILKSKEEVKDVDIFVIADDFPEYIKDFISDKNYQRLSLFKSFVSNRMKQIKNEL